MSTQDDGRKVGYTRSPLAKRLPSVGSLALAFLLAGMIGHALWLRLLVFFATLAICILVLRFVFRQPIERLIAYQEYDDE
jgi:hypothetical protein